jgi:hypothetical protein
MRCRLRCFKANANQRALPDVVRYAKHVIISPWKYASSMRRNGNLNLMKVNAIGC